MFSFDSEQEPERVDDNGNASIDYSNCVFLGRGLESIYVFHFHGLETRKKIGCTREQSVKARLKQFVTTGAPGKICVDLVILCDNAVYLERKIHHELDHCRVHGEWFNIRSIENILKIAGVQTDWNYRNQISQEIQKLQTRQEIEKKHFQI